MCVNVQTTSKEREIIGWKPRRVHTAFGRVYVRSEGSLHSLCDQEQTNAH
jgi:hypothetical protein